MGCGLKKKKRKITEYQVLQKQDIILSVCVCACDMKQSRFLTVNNILKATELSSGVSIIQTNPENK